VLSDRFWGSYEKMRHHKETRFVPQSEQSLEQRALNNLTTLINNVHSENVLPYKDFLRMLKEDILDYGTLSDYTLRRIANITTSDEAKLKNALDEIRDLGNELGEDYLIREKAKQKDLSKEIIIAVENRIL
jgi:uncharacterized protein YaaR (DUF327 family)